MRFHSPAAAVPLSPRRRFHLWIPVTLIWIVLLPFVLLFAPLVFVVGILVGSDPLQCVAAYWQFFSALRGVKVEVEDPGARIRIV